MKASRGFTLVELSVVIIIIGLLVGAVLGGKALIEAARLRSAGVDAQQFISAAKQFQERYQSLPGDFPAAKATWSAAVSCATMDDASQSRDVCDGDGDGRIGDLPLSKYFEGFHAWKHLAKAGLVSPPSIKNNSTTQWAMPPSKINGAGFLFIHIGQMSGDSAFYNGDYGNGLLFGGRALESVPPFSGASTPYPPLYPIVSSADAGRIDAKYDDSYPATGTVRGYVKNAAWNEGNCTTSASAAAGAAAAYDLTQPSDQRSCGLIFLTGF